MRNWTPQSRCVEFRRISSAKPVYSVGVVASDGDLLYLFTAFHVVPALIAPAGTVVGVYTDFTPQRVWWTVDGVNFYVDGSVSENPATNVGGFNPAQLFELAGPPVVYNTVYPAFGSLQSGPGGAGNFAGPFALPVAAGFSPWDPSRASNFFFAA